MKFAGLDFTRPQKPGSFIRSIALASSANRNTAEVGIRVQFNDTREKSRTFDLTTSRDRGG